MRVPDAMLQGKLCPVAAIVSAIAVAAWVSVVAAALAVSIELAVDGRIAFQKVLPAMLGTHALIGLGEAVITAAVCAAFASNAVASRARWRVAAPLAATVVAALLLSPFASGYPDGLEWVAEKKL